MNPLNSSPAPSGVHKSAEAPKSAVPRSVDPDEIIRLWILRLTAHYFVAKNLLGISRHHLGLSRERASTEFSNGLFNDVATITFFHKPKGITDHEALRLMLGQIRRRIRLLEKKLCHIEWIEAVDANARKSLRAVAELLGLDDGELRCLAFLLMLNRHDEFGTASSVFQCEADDRPDAEATAAAIGLPLRTVQDAFSRDGRLVGSHLIRFGHRKRGVRVGFTWVSESFPKEMMMPDFDPFRALRGHISQPPAPRLAMEQFSHLGDFRGIAISYLRQALASRRPGVNILLHGDPGVGKSELTRTLASELGCALYEVSTEDETGDPISGVSRLQALRFLHSLCAGKRCMIVFDEIEDIFPRWRSSSDAPVGKGWINRILETGPCVTFWLTNSVGTLDPAFVRRFDLALEMKNPPAKARETHLRSLPVALPDSVIARMADCADLTPAVVSRAAAVVSSIESALPASRGPLAMEIVVNQTLRALGFEELKAGQPGDSVYDPVYINSDIDLVSLVEGIRGAKSARLCLHGPPGTGKTAYAQWLARHLGRRIHVKRASDLLSPFVGMAEKQMAGAFREAQQSDAVLLIDEVDSFLQERSKALRSWEVTQVNEFLTQMEQFQGVFIASTNLMDGLDAAALRRFDLKARFDYLRPEQSRGLLAAHLAAAGVAPADSPAIVRLDSIQVLTPGDFAAVARQHRFRPLTTADAWVSALEAECSQKPTFHRRILGFGINTAP